MFIPDSRVQVQANSKKKLHKKTNKRRAMFIPDSRVTTVVVKNLCIHKNVSL